MTTTLDIRPDRERRHAVAASSTAPHAPRVSIIIPAYNEETAIEQCRLAAGTETVPAWEILVVDNRSTYWAAQIVRRVAADHPGSPIRLLERSAARGLVPTGNLGFAPGHGRRAGAHRRRHRHRAGLGGARRRGHARSGGRGDERPGDLLRRSPGRQRRGTRRSRASCAAPPGRRVPVPLRQQHGHPRRRVADDPSRGLPRRRGSLP
jgi:hypothetical protein